MIISHGNRERNADAVNYVAKYAYDRKKINFPVYIDLIEEQFEIKGEDDFLKLLDNKIYSNIFQNQSIIKDQIINELCKQLKGIYIFIIDNFDMIPLIIRPIIINLCCTIIYKF